VSKKDTNKKGEKTMAKDFLTDEAVEMEIARLTNTNAVKLARREQRLKYKRRQQLYTLRALEKRGKELAAAGITIENIDEMMKIAEGELE
jgi:hypothetical protein